MYKYKCALYIHIGAYVYTLIQYTMYKSLAYGRAGFARDEPRNIAHIRTMRVKDIARM